MAETKTHSVTLENRKRMLLTGIVEVVSQIDKSVIAKTERNTVTISGSGLRVGKLNLEEGVLIVEGEIDGFKYGEISGGKGFFRRLMK